MIFVYVLLIFGLFSVSCAGAQTTLNSTTPIPGPRPTPTPVPAGLITLNPEVRFQTMTGWEATAEAGQLYSKAWNKYKNQVLNAAVELGINRLRVEVTSGAENPVDYFAEWQAGRITEKQYEAKRYEIINDDANPNNINPKGFKWSKLDSTIDTLVIPLRQKLAATGETLQVNVNYVDFGPSAFEHKNNGGEYAEFVLAAYQHLQTKYGFVPDYWEVCLEPDTDSAAWSAVQLANAIKAAGDRLKANGFTPQFIAPSTTSAGYTVPYIDQIFQTPGAMPYVSEFSYHRYMGVDPEILQAIAQRTTENGKKSAMLEWIGADYNTLHVDLKTVNNSAWQQYCLAGIPEWGSDDGGSYFTANDTNQNNPIVEINSRTRFLRQYFKFIRRGAVRIGATGANSRIDPLAFINPDGGYTVIVKASTGSSFSVKNLPGGTYGIKFTTFTEYNADLPDAAISSGEELTSSIPAAGVLTIYRKTQSPNKTALASFIPFFADVYLLNKDIF